ncbi:hypothetical protein AALP_AA7G053200, partial [Arabis alpina]
MGSHRKRGDEPSPEVSGGSENSIHELRGEEEVKLTGKRRRGLVGV